ncbi:MAG TPA: GDCCVxC domain-containing (seleno)protein [Bacteroidia bacterium]|nr:GDCCVxC domain-containing (seleno)protein [Bacteroidia bacterium]
MKVKIIHTNDMPVKYFLIMMVVLLFIQCSSSTQNTTVTKSNLNDLGCRKDSTTDKNVTAMQSVITCPKCGHKKTETMPTDVCLLKYTCTNCKAELRPRQGDCCVFCTYGTHKCPSMQ